MAGVFSDWPELDDPSLFFNTGSNSRVEVFGFNLDLPDSLFKRLEKIILTPKDGDDHKKLDLHLRRESVISRGILILLISLTSGRSCSDLSFGFESFGKPRIVTSKEGSSIPSFSLTHSDTYGLAGLSFSRREIGIDLERQRAIRFLDDVIRYGFSTEEQKTLFTFPRNERSKQFITVWCRKEAVVKALGESIARFLSLFSVPTNKEPESTFEVTDRSSRVHRLYLEDLPLGPGYSGAVCGIGFPPHPRYQFLSDRSLRGIFALLEEKELLT